MSIHQNTTVITHVITEYNTWLNFTDGRTAVSLLTPSAAGCLTAHGCTALTAVATGTGGCRTCVPGACMWPTAKSGGECQRCQHMWAMSTAVRRGPADG